MKAILTALMLLTSSTAFAGLCEDGAFVVAKEPIESSYTLYRCSNGSTIQHYKNMTIEEANA